MSLFMPCPTKSNAKDYVADLINLNYHKKINPDSSLLHSQMKPLHHFLQLFLCFHKVAFGTKCNFCRKIFHFFSSDFPFSKWKWKCSPRLPTSHWLEAATAIATSGPQKSSQIQNQQFLKVSFFCAFTFWKSPSMK